MKKIILLVVLVFSVQLFSQPDGFRKSDDDKFPFHKLVYTQTLTIPGDSISTIYYLFKLPYQNIVFLKDQDVYKAEIRLDVEVSDTNSNFVKREIKDWKVQAASFEQTDSPQLFVEGFVYINLPNGIYNLLPIITDQNSKREFKLENVKLDVFSKGEKYIEPLIIDSKKINCEGNDFYKLTNFGDGIPFGFTDQDLIIPVTNTSLEKINIAVLSLKDTIYNGSVTDSYISSIDLNECSGKILISEKIPAGLKTKNFIVSGISSKLKEGPFTIIINGDKDKRSIHDVFWYNKPASLRNPEFAIKALKYIKEENVIDSLLDLDEKDMYKGLVEYWKKMDPTPGTEFNELMAQYYTRVDYAQMSFSSITGIKGVDSDRGKIYIKFGKPNQVERSSSEKGKIVETWVYEKPQRKFVFIDRQGVGEFSLENS